MANGRDVDHRSNSICYLPFATRANGVSPCRATVRSSDASARSRTWPRSRTRCSWWPRRRCGALSCVRNIAVGKKGRDFLVRGGFTVVAEYLDLGDYPSAADISPIVRQVIGEFLDGLTDRVLMVYPDFVNTVTQRPTVRQL